MPLVFFGFAQVTGAEIVRVAKNGQGDAARLREGHRIVSIMDDTRTYTSVKDITTVLHTFTGTICVTSMPLNVYSNVLTPPDYV